VADDRHADRVRQGARAVELKFAKIGFFLLTLPGLDQRCRDAIARVLREEQAALIADLVALLDEVIDR
jgi:hypothetical protein